MSVRNTIGRFVVGLCGPWWPPVGPEQSGCAPNTEAVSTPRVLSVTQRPSIRGLGPLGGWMSGTAGTIHDSAAFLSCFRGTTSNLFTTKGFNQGALEEIQTTLKTWDQTSLRQLQKDNFWSFLEMTTIYSFDCGVIEIWSILKFPFKNQFVELKSNCWLFNRSLCFFKRKNFFSY